MTDIEQEARDLLNAVSQERFGYESFDMADSRINHRALEAVCRALEQRNAANADAAEQALADFRREVSDEIKRMFIPPAELRRFILPDPVNPRVAALREWLKSRGISDPNDDVLADDFARLEAILAEHGGEVVFKGNDAP